MGEERDRLIEAQLRTLLLERNPNSKALLEVMEEARAEALASVDQAFIPLDPHASNPLPLSPLHGPGSYGALPSNSLVEIDAKKEIRDSSIIAAVVIIGGGVLLLIIVILATIYFHGRFTIWLSICVPSGAIYLILAIFFSVRAARIKNKLYGYVH